MKKPSRDTIIKHLPYKYFVIEAETYKIVDTNNPQLRVGKFCYSEMYNIENPCCKSGGDCICNQNTHKKDFIANYQNIDGVLCASLVSTTPIFDDKNNITHRLIQHSAPQAYIDQDRAEENIIESNTPLSAYTEDPKYVYSIDGQILFANKQATINLSKGTASIIGKNIRDFLSDDHVQIFLNLFKKAITNNITIKQNIPNPTTEKAKWFSNTLKPIIFGSKMEQAVLSTSKDITQFVLAEDLVKQSETSFKMLAETISDVIWRLDLATMKYTYVSPSVLQLRGLTVREALNESLEESLHPDDYKNILQVLNKQKETAKSGVVYQMSNKFEIRQFHKNKSIIWVEVSVSIIKDANNNAVEVLGVSRDITAKRLKKEKLVQSLGREKFFADIIRNSSQAVCVFYPNGKSVPLNNAAYQLFGYSDDEITELDWAQDLSPKNWYGFEQKQLNKAKDHNIPITYEKEIINKNDQIIPVKILAHPKFDKQGNFSHYISFITDITEIQKTQQLLEESKKRLEYAFQGSNDGLWDWDLKNDFLYMSPSYLKMIGYKRDELKPEFKTFQKLVHPSDLPSIFQSHHQYMNNAAPRFEAQFRMKHKDGHWVSVLSRSLLIKNEKGKAIRFVGTHIDLTELHQIQKHLKESEERNTILFENTNVGIAITSLDGNLLTANKQLLGMLGIQGESYENTNVRKYYLYKEDRNKFIDQMNKNGQLTNFHFQLIDKQKNIKWMSLSSKALEIDGEKRLVNILTDIDKQIKAEQDLTESQERFKQLSKLTMEGILIHDKGITIDINESLLRILGYSREEVLGKNVINMCSTKKSLNVFYEHVKNNTKDSYDAEILTKSGKVIPVEVTSKPVRYNGKNVRVTSIRNITQRKLFEKEIITEREKAKENDNLKSAFLANMSHEIRTPLNGIIGFTEILQDASAEFSPEEIEQYLAIIEKNGQVLLHLVNDIIDLSKIETGQLKINLQDVSLQEVISEVTSVFEAQVKQKGLLLISSFTDKQIILKTDYSRLVQILNNLIGNALKFTTKGSITVGCIIKDKRVILYVKDTGCGICNDAKEIIFDRFSQGKPVRDQLLGGTGLGLSITRGLIELLGGEIWLESEENKGSTFFFTLQSK